MIASVNRAAVLIGVNRTGGLPVLRKAADSARRMEAWALAQGLHRDYVRVFTDEKQQPVRITPIQDAIRELVDLDIDQLIVFFAGHGINVNRTERWLLTDAPGNPQAAVNMAGSAALAGFCGIPHVVMISDACRTAAHTIQTQSVTGSEIFPTDENSDLELPVDQFWACALGRPSYEVRETAIFTRALLTALQDLNSGAADSRGYVRPRPLKLFLQQEVPRQLQKRRLHTKVIQVPDAHIASDEHAWISQLSLPPAPPMTTGSPPPSDVSRVREATGSPTQGFTKRLLRWLRHTTSQRFDPDWSYLLTPILPLILSGRLDVLDELVREGGVYDQPEINAIITAVEASTRPPGPTQYETRCGFNLRGASLRRVTAGGVRAEQLNDGLVRIHLAERRSGNVLLELDDGYGIALPAISGFITSLTINDGELVEVVYEPSENTWRWEEFIQRADEVRALRAFAASSAREGVFHLDGDDAVEVARRMQYSKGVDPALAVYAAYTYADNGRRDLIRRMSRYMYEDLGAVLFDLALLAREPDRSYLTSNDGLLGFAPLFAQGWALLAASQFTLPESLADLQRHVVPESLWTLYDQIGVERIRYAFAIGELR